MSPSNPSTDTDAPNTPPTERRFSVRRMWPLGVLALGTATVFALGVDEYLTVEALRANHDALKAFVAEHALAAPLGFMALYAAAVAFSLPGGAAMTVAGGFLFGSVIGTGWVVIAATIGATAVFLIARSTLGDALRARAGAWLVRLSLGFRENALSYLLTLRLIPLFPFFVVNLVPAFLGVPLRTYVVGTFVGIIPGSFVYTSIGAGLGSLFDVETGGTVSLAGVLTPEIVVALVGLAALSLAPVAYKRLKAQRA